MQRSRIWTAVVVLGAISVSQTVRGDVLVVGPPWVGGTYTSIQPAVDAAHDSDVILVHTTDTAGFTIDGKGVSVVEWPGHAISLVGTINVRNVPAGRTVLLNGISSKGTALYPKSLPALVLQSNAGLVRVQDGTFSGGGGAQLSVTCGYGAGGDAAVIESSPKVILQRCTIMGGSGGGDAVNACTAGDGGHGVLTSGSALALYDCQVTGGLGGSSDGAYPIHVAGNGGDGVHISSWGAFFSGGLARGGKGGYSYSGGSGGAGVFIDPSAQARFLDVTLQGGAAGPGEVLPGLAGSPTSGGGQTFVLPEDAVQLHATSVSPDHVALEVVGNPGQTVWLFSSRRADQRFVESLTGIATFPANTWTTLQPVGTIPASGKLQLDVPIIAPFGPAGTMWMQALAQPAVGDPVLSSPRAVTTLAAPLPPG